MYYLCVFVFAVLLFAVGRCRELRFVCGLVVVAVRCFRSLAVLLCLVCCTVAPCALLGGIGVCCLLSCCFLFFVTNSC